MPRQLIFVLAGLAGAFATAALLLWWWLNRTPRVKRIASEDMPLFGGSDPSDFKALPALSRPHPRNGQVTPGSAPRIRERMITPAGAAIAAAERGAAEIAAEQAAAAAAAAAAHAELMRASRSAFDRPRSMPTPENNPGVLTFSTNRPQVSPNPQGSPLRAASATPSRAVAAAAATRPTSVVSAAGVPGTMVEGQLLRFSVPAEGTLQFLPGRLEIASGVDVGREIRFVHVPGPDGPLVTFGRSEGELYRHIQLRDQTVSRTHARMRMVNGAWQLLSLSKTNPVVHNGSSIADGEERPLADGDRIEMGEVLFTFRSR